MPVIKLNDKSIRALKAPDPSGQQTFYWDENQTGFAVLVSGKTKTKSFVAKGQLNGKGVLKSLGKVGVMTQDEARQAAREVFRDIGAGVHPRQRRASLLTLGETLTAYLSGNDLKPRTREAYADLASRYFHDWTDTPLMDISREMVEARYRAIAKQVEDKHLRFSGKASANGAMRVLRAVYNYALDKTDELPPNPVRLKRQWNKIAPRERVVSVDQMPAFYRAVLNLPSPIGRDYLLLVMFTGLRRREAAALRWSEVDLAGKTLSIPGNRNKSGRQFNLPLTDYVHDLLVARRAIGRTEFIFHADSKSGHLEHPHYFLTQIAKETGVKISVHDLRRGYITIAESCEISPIALKALVNHSQGKDVTAGYVQIVVERLRPAAQKVTDRIKSLAGIVESSEVVRLRR